MTIKDTTIPVVEILIIKPKVFKVPRGYLFERFSQRDFEAQVRPLCRIMKA